MNIAVIDKIHWLLSATTSQSHVKELLDTVHLSALGRLLWIDVSLLYNMLSMVVH